jgi:hypothetical protein
VGAGLARRLFFFRLFFFRLFLSWCGPDPVGAAYSNANEQRSLAKYMPGPFYLCPLLFRTG